MRINTEHTFAPAKTLWILAAFMLLVPGICLGGIVNGDFDLGPADTGFGWVLEGAVIPSAGQIELTEGTENIADLSQVFILPGSVNTLSIAISSLNVFPNDSGEKDAFVIGLLEASSQDSFQDSLVDLPDIPGGDDTSLFNYQLSGDSASSGIVYYSPQVAFSSTPEVPASGGSWVPTGPFTLTIDLSGITTDKQALIYFSLISFGEPDDSSVIVDKAMLVSPPVATDDLVQTDEDVPVLIDVTANDTDADGLLVPATVEIVSCPAYGTAGANAATGKITYGPALNYNGTDQFSYRVKDDTGLNSNEATVSITVAPVNDPPTAHAGSDRTVNEGSTVTLDASLSTDVDDGIQSYFWEQTGGDTNVTLLTPAASQTQFTAPAAGTQGLSLAFRLTVTDNGGLTSRDTVTITVVAAGVTAPTASDDTVQTDEDTPVDIDVLANDLPVNEINPATVALLDEAAHGSVSVNAVTGVVTYAPDGDYSGADGFSYSVQNGGGVVSNEAFVTITVISVNDAPVAVAGSDQSVTSGVQVALDGTGSSDADGLDDIASFQWTQVGGSPQVDITGSGASQAGFTAPTADTGGALLTFRLTVTDAQGATDTDDVSVNVSILVPPQAADDTAATDEDTASAPIDVLANDFDEDGLDPTTVAVVEPPGHGNVAVDGANGRIVYTPETDFYGIDVFTYKVMDNTGVYSNEATVTVTVESVNDGPTAHAGVDQSVPEGSQVILDGSQSTDVDDGIASYLWQQTAGTPSVSIQNAGASQAGFTAPDIGETNVDLTFTVTVTDNGGLEDADVIVVQVVPQGAVAPVAMADSAATGEDTAVVVDVLLNDSDDDGDLDPTTVAIVSAPLHGTVTSIDGATGVVRYLPGKDYSGSDTFSYTVKDNDGILSNAAVVTVAVTAVNDPPVARAGVDRTVVEGRRVVLDGTASSDVDDGIASWAWALIAPAAVQVPISNDTTSQPSFTAPEVNGVAVSFEFQLTVTDAGGLNASDTVTIKVLDLSLPCDVDDSGTVDLADAIASLQALAGRVPAGTVLSVGADTNGDGRLGMAEGICALQTSAALRMGIDVDADGDGFSIAEGDCNDFDDTIHPGAAEICGDDIDQNCDGEDAVCPGIYFDDDGDGFSEMEGDCDDTDIHIYPGAAERCNGLDDDCDGSPAADEVDSDEDGYRICEGDCDDGNADVYPGAQEICGDGIDQDCDGEDAECTSVVSGTAELYSRNWDDVDGFHFSTQTVMVNAGDFTYEINIIFLAPMVGVQDLGTISLTDLSSVPGTGYTVNTPDSFEDDSYPFETGHVYAFKIPDGTF